MTDSNYDDSGLISNSNDGFDTALHQKLLQLSNSINLDTGLTTNLDDDLFDDVNNSDLNWQSDLDNLDGIFNVPFTSNVILHEPDVNASNASDRGAFSVDQPIENLFYLLK